MTREEALQILDTIPTIGEQVDALEMAIQALENHDIFMKYAYSQGKQDALSQEQISLNDINNALEASFRNGVRSAKVQKSGKWINDECGNVICSECKRFRRDCRYGHTNYCNHCGAKMEREEISERNMKMWEEIFKAERSGK